MSKTAGIIVIGNEILSGKIRDENSPYLAGELRALGVNLRSIEIISDNVVAGVLRLIGVDPSGYLPDAEVFDAFVA